MTEQIPSNPQTPVAKLIHHRTTKIVLNLLGVILIGSAICFVIQIVPFLLEISSVGAQDIVIGTELDGNGHVLKDNRTISADVKEIYLGFYFHNRKDSAVTLQFCWGFEGELLYCDEQSYENGYVVKSLNRDRIHQSSFPTGKYEVRVYDFVVSEDDVMVFEDFVVK